jgi:hypothetical protein
MRKILISFLSVWFLSVWHCCHKLQLYCLRTLLLYRGIPGHRDPWLVSNIVMTPWPSDFMAFVYYTCCTGTEPGPQARAEDGEGRVRQQAGGERSGKQIVTKATTTFIVLFARKLRSPSRVVFCQRLSHNCECWILNHAISYSGLCPAISTLQKSKEFSSNIEHRAFHEERFL